MMMCASPVQRPSSLCSVLKVYGPTLHVYTLRRVRVGPLQRWGCRKGSGSGEERAGEDLMAARKLQSRQEV
jgi:hypothetical protein